MLGRDDILRELYNGGSGEVKDKFEEYAGKNDIVKINSKTLNVVL